MCRKATTRSLLYSLIVVVAFSINGVPACANQLLLTNITRNEWGFKGYIVSDAGAVLEIMTDHKFRNTSTETAAAAIKAGCNLELGSTVFNSQLDAIKMNLLTEKDLRSNVFPLMYTRLRLGEFDPESMNPYSSIGMDVVQSTKHRQLAVQAGSMSLVLLKNEDCVLPFKTTFNKIAVRYYALVIAIM